MQVSSKEGRFGNGMCVRDSHGRFFMARIECFNSAPSIKEGEALRLLAALRWPLPWVKHKCSLSLDCKAVTDGIKRSKEDKTEFGAILSQCKELLNHLFPNSNMSFVRRQTNLMAHCDVRTLKLYACSHVFEYVPHCILNQIINERL